MTAGWGKGLKAFFPHQRAQSSQYQFFNLFFLQRSLMPASTSIKCPYIHEVTSELCFGLSLFCPISLFVAHSLNKYTYSKSCSVTGRFLILAILGPLLSHIHFRISLITVTKKKKKSRQGFDWDYIKHLDELGERMAIFTILFMNVVYLFFV